MALVAFDIDGTLLDVDEGTDYEDIESVRAGARANAVSLQRVLEVIAAGHRVAYVTGRCGHLRPLTAAQLLDAGFPRGEVVMNAAWQGYDHMAAYKGDALHAIQAAIYIGDHEADRKAAQRAGIPFIHVDEFRAGALSHSWRQSLSDGPMISQRVEAGG